MAKATTAAATTGSEPEGLTTGAELVATTAQGLARIESRADADRAGQFLRGVRERIRSIKAHYTVSKRAVDEAKRKILDQEKADLAPWVLADLSVAAPLLAFTVADRQRVEAENRARLVAAEETARQDKARAAEQLRAAATTAQTASERTALQRQARQVDRAPVLAVAPEMEAPLKIDGVSTPTRYRGVVTNEDLLLRAVLAGKVPRAAVTVDQKFVDAQANDLGRDLNWPGVMVRDDTTLAARG